mmetsp:Transcript_37516/g.64732  ORF Transcript_37516/g.64732 Transcript_37516/m.64732 type:complete len:263 (-) Transcript_37516:106-894(-)
MGAQHFGHPLHSPLLLTYLGPCFRDHLLPSLNDIGRHPTAFPRVEPPVLWHRRECRKPRAPFLFLFLHPRPHFEIIFNTLAHALDPQLIREHRVEHELSNLIVRKPCAGPPLAFEEELDRVPDALGLLLVAEDAHLLLRLSFGRLLFVQPRRHVNQTLETLVAREIARERVCDRRESALLDELPALVLKCILWTIPTRQLVRRPCATLALLSTPPCFEAEAALPQLHSCFATLHARLGSLLLAWVTARLGDFQRDTRFGLGD